MGYLLLICLIPLGIYLLISIPKHKEEKKEGVLYSDNLAKYMGGIPDKIGGKTVNFKLMKDKISIDFYSNKETLNISIDNITNISIKTTQQVINDTSLGKIIAFGALGIGLKDKETVVNNYLLLEYKKGGQEYKTLYEINKYMIEPIIKKVNELKCKVA